MSVKCVSLDDVLYCNTTHHLDFVVEQFSDVAQVMADDGETCLDGVLTSATDERALDALRKHVLSCQFDETHRGMFERALLRVVPRRCQICAFVAYV